MLNILNAVGLNGDRYFPEGIDIYFDNVGGDMLEAALLNMRRRGRIAVAGMISQYDLDEPQELSEYHIQADQSRSLHRKITYVEDIAEGLENGPAALEAMFQGRSAGKQVVILAHE
ncbi:hypothetical protein JHK82_029514 [Glycine max]|nr:hypothetical protein JHK86_029630 [Glycine max]KAG5128679.1 hypothetical protein JHK82_029514 [Glycine max]